MHAAWDSNQHFLIGAVENMAAALDITQALLPLHARAWDEGPHDLACRGQAQTPYLAGLWTEQLSRNSA